MGTEGKVTSIMFSWRKRHPTGPPDGGSHGLCGNGIAKVTTVVRTYDNHQIDIEETNSYENGEVDVL